MFCRTLLLLLSALLVLLTLAAAQPPQSIADVRITAISGCVDVGSVTVNCSVATTTLRIQTAAGFSATTIWATRPLYTQAHLGNYEYFVTTAAWLDPLDSTNTSVYVNVTANSYYPHITDTLISVSFIDYYTPGQPTSPPFAGFSYRFEGPPTLTAIGGCEGSGLSTLNCVPDSSIIELWGSGLLWYASGSYYLGKEINIGDQSTTLFNDLRVVNDSYATLPLALTYGTLLKPQHYAGVLLPLSFTSIAFGRSGQTDYSYTTNQLQISFIPLPAPVILQWSITDCNETYAYNLTTYTSCVPGLSTVTLYGHYMYDMNVSVGGVPCPPLGAVSYASFSSCILPSFDFDPDTAYDLVASNDAATTTLPGLVRYSAVPTLASIDACIDRGDMYDSWRVGVQCPAGTTITLRGSRFPGADAVVVQFVPYFAPSYIVNLTAATLVNSSTITATLPALDGATAAAVYGEFGTIKVLFTSSSGVSTTTTLVGRLYKTPDAPTITSVSSTMCDSVSALRLVNCRATAAITVTGANLAINRDLDLATSLAGEFLGWNYLVPTASNATWYTSRSNTTVVFRLAYFDADTNVQLQPGVVYTMFTLSTMSLNSFQQDASNAFRLSLTYSTAPADTTPRLSSGAIAGIVIAAVAVALVLLLAVVWLVRRRTSGGSSLWSKSLGGWSTQSDGGSGGDEYKDVELQRG